MTYFIMQTDIFHLKIVPIADILVHEKYDDSRAIPLVERLKQDSYLCNPIIVTSIGKSKYLQVDGMNRLSAFKMLGLTSILVQVIDYNNQETVELSSWLHLFKGKIDDFIIYIQSQGNNVIKSRFDQIGHRYIKEEGKARLCTLVCADGSVFLVYTNGNLIDKVYSLNKIVDYYKKHIKRDVLPVKPNRVDIEILFEEHTNINNMVIFPTFTRHQIIKIVQKGGLFPSGITRHIIQRRCLNINIPLALFAKNKSIKKQNNQLEEILSQKKFRLYEEATIYFE